MSALARWWCVGLFALAGRVGAEEPARPNEISSEQVAIMLRAYNHGERATVIPFAGAGVATMTTGALLLGPLANGPLTRDAAWPLLGVGAVELIAGVLFSFNAWRNLDKLETLLAADPGEFARVERKHVHRITDVYQPVLLIVEAVATLVGIGLAVAGNLRVDPGLQGAGYGVAAQGLTLFLLDWSVLDRARAYVAGLDRFHPEPDATP